MKNNWISVKEKLPEKEGLYLAILRNHVNDKCYHYSLLNFTQLKDNEYGFKWEGCNLAHYIVTHWAAFEKFKENA